MGGIWFCVYDNTSYSSTKFNTEFIKGFENLKHRGPSASQLLFEESIRIDQINKDILKRTLKRSEIINFKSYTFVFGYHRLAINDLSADGDQPFEWFHKSMRPGPSSSKVLSMCNGEIYNWKSIKSEFNLEADFVSECDCEVILHLYNKFNLIDDDEYLVKRITNLLEGEYSFVIGDNLNTFDKKKIKSYVVRDPLGLKPLYYLRKKDNSIILFVSELKGIPLQFLDDPNYEISIFPPGSYWSFFNWVSDNNSGIKKYFMDFDNLDYVYIDKTPETVEKIYNEMNNLLKESLKKRIPNNKFGITISGGVGSSILANLILEILDQNYQELDKMIEFFTVGKINIDNELNTDVIRAKNLIKYFNSKYNTKFKHHIITCNDLSFINKRRDIISSAIETNNEELIESCIPFSFLYEYIQKFVPDISVIMSGEGCDELLGVQSQEYQSSSDFISILHKDMTLKVDKLAGMYSLEVRLPYLDLDFVKFCLSISPELKELVPYLSIDQNQNIFIEKYLLRKANETSENPLPNEFLFRQPEKASLN